MADGYEYSPSILTNILSRRKAEARQAMLDDLSRRQIEGNLDVQRENAENNRIWRQGQAEAAEALAEQRRLGTFTMGQDISDPTTVKWFQERGLGHLMKPTQDEVGARVGHMVDPGPDDSGEITGEPSMVFDYDAQTQASPKKFTFAGMPKEQQQASFQQRIHGALQDPNTPDALKRALMYQMLTQFGDAGGDNPPAEALLPQTKKDLIYDQDKGEVVEGPEMGPHDTLHMGSRAPAPVTPTYQYFGVDENGQPLFAGNRAGKDGVPPVVAGKTPTGGPVRPKPSNAPGGRTSRVPQGIIQDYSEAKGKVAGSAGRWFNGSGYNAASASRDTLQNTIINFGSTQAVKQAVRDTMADLATNDGDFSSEDIVKSEYANLSPAEQAEIIDILYQVRGK